MGCRIASTATADPVHTALNQAWLEFRQSPAVYSSREKALIMATRKALGWPFPDCSLSESWQGPPCLLLIPAPHLGPTTYDTYDHHLPPFTAVVYSGDLRKRTTMSRKTAGRKAKRTAIGRWVRASISFPPDLYETLEQLALARLCCAGPRARTGSRPLGK